MRKIIVLVALLLLLLDMKAQTVKNDTVYIYETHIVYDTIVVYDTVRLFTPPVNLPYFHRFDSAVIFFDKKSATFFKDSIMFHESINQINNMNMKFRKSNYLAVLMMMLHGMTNLSAQEASDVKMKNIPAQLSFVYPMTTQGKGTVDYKYNFSLNILTGKVGAVNGLEFGGLYNKVLNNMNGAQVGGLGNMANNVTGLQFGGIWNISKTVKGAQVGGILNMSDDVNGMQFGGIFNMSENVKGMQTGGIVNIARNVNGFQFGGIANLAEDVKGAQFAGVVNVSEESKGFQFAGIANINKTSSGVTMGIVNKTGVLKGVKFGVINVTDTVESGVPVGLINIVRNGRYSEWEFSVSDYSNIGVSYKTGLKKLYSVYTLGANFLEDELFIAGIGIGNRTSLSKRFDLQPELITYVYMPTDFKMKSVVTSATRLKLGLTYNLSEKTGISIAPSFYFLNCDRKDNVKEYKITSISPMHENSKAKNYRYEYGIGLSLGFILR